MAENLVRSAKPPMARAVVMAAKVIWKQTKTSSWMPTPSEKVSTLPPISIPERNALLRPPKNGARNPAPSVKARL